MDAPDHEVGVCFGSSCGDENATGELLQCRCSLAADVR